MQRFTHRVRSGRKHIAREPHPCELASLELKSSRSAMPCRSDRRVGLKTGRRLRSRAMIYADRDPPVIISRACSARLPAERRASSPAEPTTFTPVHFWTGQIQCLSARHTEVPCRSHRLAVSPHGRRDAARTGAPCWSKRLRSARTRGTSEDLNVWPRRRRSSEPTVNRSIAQWAMSALFARTVSPSRRMGDVPRRARPRLAGRSVSEPRALAERVGVLLFGGAKGAKAVAAGDSFFDERWCAESRTLY